MNSKLLSKFVLSLGVLGVALTVTISLFSYLSSKEYLEEMYAQRVVSGSKSVATMLDIEDVRAIIGPGGENSEVYSHVESMLNTLKKDGDITYDVSRYAYRNRNAAGHYELLWNIHIGTGGYVNGLLCISVYHNQIKSDHPVKKTCICNDGEL